MNSVDVDSEVRRIAKQYENEGYAVTVRPKGDAVPPFLIGYDLDILAVRGDEHVVAVVRRNRRSLNADPGTTRVADAVSKKPGWRFDVVVLESDTPLNRIAEKALEPSGLQFQGMLNRARVAKDAGLNDMAITYAWAALEAAMRRLRDDTELYGRTTATELLQTLYGNGFLSAEEFNRAMVAWTIRTQAVHGFVTQEIDPALIEDVILLASKVMGSEELQLSTTTG